jgi:hypothetical protein
MYSLNLPVVPNKIVTLPDETREWLAEVLAFSDDETEWLNDIFREETPIDIFRNVDRNHSLVLVENTKTQEVKAEAFEKWNDYPVHQAVLRYLKRNPSKSAKEIYNRVKNDRKNPEIEPGSGKVTIEQIRNVLAYLLQTRYINLDESGNYSLSLTIPLA